MEGLAHAGKIGAMWFEKLAQALALLTSSDITLFEAVYNAHVTVDGVSPIIAERKPTLNIVSSLGRSTAGSVNIDANAPLEEYLSTLENNASIVEAIEASIQGLRRRLVAGSARMTIPPLAESYLVAPNPFARGRIVYAYHPVAVPHEAYVFYTRRYIALAPDFNILQLELGTEREPRIVFDRHVTIGTAEIIFPHPFTIFHINGEIVAAWNKRQEVGFLNEKYVSVEDVERGSFMERLFSSHPLLLY